MCVLRPRTVCYHKSNSGVLHTCSYHISYSIHLQFPLLSISFPFHFNPLPPSNHLVNIYPTDHCQILQDSTRVAQYSEVRTLLEVVSREPLCLGGVGESCGAQATLWLGLGGYKNFARNKAGGEKAFSRKESNMNAVNSCNSQ